MPQRGVAEGPAKAETVSEPGAVRLHLPVSVPALVGTECNLYFDNAVLTPNSSALLFDVVCEKGRQLDERWAWSPTKDDVGVTPLRLEVRDAENRLIASGTTEVRVSQRSEREEPLSVLCVGDSITHGSAYTGRLLELGKTDAGPLLRLVGTNWIGEPSDNRHEGYSGWTAKHFVTHYTGAARGGEYGRRGSPFLYVTKEGEQPLLDFGRYCDDANGGKAPDIVTIFLGPNDVFHYTDETIGAGVDQMLGYIDDLIQAIHRYAPKTKVAVLTPVPPAATQDAFGASYRSGQTRWQYRRNQHRLVERMLETFSNREHELVYLVPTHLNLDCIRNYHGRTENVNGTSDKQVWRQTDGVHPDKDGHRQIADTIFAWLNSQAE